jgi:chromosome segregation ATPase
MNKDFKNTHKNYQKETAQQKAVQKEMKDAAKTSFNSGETEATNYSYYSRVLNKPFDSLSELRAAEAEHFSRLKAKEDKAAQKKADAKKVEDAFIALNATRKAYKDELNVLTTEYSKNLIALKEAFEEARDDIKVRLAKAEDEYSAAIKAFTDKYPEGYHLTLKDGDFETTISGSTNKSSSETFDTNKAFQMLDWLFNL